MKDFRMKMYLLLFTFGAINILKSQVTFNIPANQIAGTVNKIEYFFDVDPGFGNGSSSISFASATDVTVTNATVSIAGLNNGVHRLYTRSKNSNGAWSHSNVTIFFIVNLSTSFPSNTALASINKMEYFIDTDPGFGNGVNIPVTANTDVIVTNFIANVNGPANGIHRIYTRSKNINGRWSLTNVQNFYIVNLSTTFPSNAAPANISRLEYFVDTDPGFGNATNIPIANALDVAVNNYAVTVGNLSTGIHRLYVRSKTINGKWAITNLQLFAVVNSINIPATASSGVVTRLEYFVDTDPGFGNGTIVNVTPTSDLNNYSFAANIGNLSAGNHTFYIRSFAKWSLTNIFPFGVNSPLPLTLLSFNAQQNDKNVLLKWITNNQINTNYFDVERSNDGIHFNKIEKVAAQNYTANTNDYSCIDPNVPLGILYYRLKIVDTNGSFTYSPIVIINNKKILELELHLYPNPATIYTNIQLPTLAGQHVAVNIFNEQGQLVKQILQKNATQIQISIAELASGTYHVFVNDGQNKYTKKLIVKH